MDHPGSTCFHFPLHFKSKKEFLNFFSTFWPVRAGYILAGHLYHQCSAKLRPFFPSRSACIGHEPASSQMSNEIHVGEIDYQLLAKIWVP